MTKIGISTGSIWRWMKSGNRNELVDYLRACDVSAAELASGSGQELNSLRLSDENIKWLRGLPFVSIHAPAFSRSAGNKSELEEQLKILDELALLIDADTVVIHPEDLPPSEILDKYSFQVSIENMGPDKYLPATRISALLDDNPLFKLCLDVSHAALISENEAAGLVSLFGDRISHVHFSGTKDGRDHLSLIGASRQFYQSTEDVRHLEVPFIIEEDLQAFGIELLQRELAEAERLLCGCRV